MKLYKDMIGRTISIGDVIVAPLGQHRSHMMQLRRVVDPFQEGGIKVINDAKHTSVIRNTDRVSILGNVFTDPHIQAAAEKEGLY